MFVLIVSYLVLVFVLPVALSALVSYRSLPMGRQCPQCCGDTLQLHARLLRALSRAHPRAQVQRRWCLACGWEGATRLPRERTPARVPSLGAQTVDAQSVGGQSADKLTGGTQTLDVRSVTVDGRPFRVMLQCWTTTGLFYGRLVFVGASGRLWLDAVEAFSGGSRSEVLGQALSLPDGLLQNRLRRLVSD